MIVISIITGYLVIMNLIGFVVMGIDKRRAVKRSGEFQSLRFLLLH